jgi:hypothetical protein
MRKLLSALYGDPFPAPPEKIVGAAQKLAVKHLDYNHAGALHLCRKCLLRT